MILFLAAAAAIQAAPSPTPPAESNVCGRAMSYDDAVCEALQSGKSLDFRAAAEAYERAARYAVANSPKAAHAYAAAGNMWIAAGEPGKAALDLDRALTGEALQAEQRGEALLDRARAAEAQDDLGTARAKVSEAVTTIGEDPFLWYFSAALAIRENDKAAAQSSIARALGLAPNDPTILFEAGHVAQFAGDEAKARHYWSQADRFDSNGPIGKAARDAMAMLAPVPADGDAGPPEKPHQ